MAGWPTCADNAMSGYKFMFIPPAAASLGSGLRDSSRSCMKIILRHWMETDRCGQGSDPKGPFATSLYIAPVRDRRFGTLNLI